MAIFGPKPWVNPFGKISIFRLFQLFVFIGQKSVFSFQNIVKAIAWHILSEKTKLENSLFLDQNHGLTPLEKCQFWTLSPSCFYSLERRCFVLEYRKRHLPVLYCLKKRLENRLFLDQNHGLTFFGKMSIFRLFKLLVFIA